MIKYLSQINHRRAVINLTNQQGAKINFNYLYFLLWEFKDDWNPKLHDHTLRPEMYFL